MDTARLLSFFETDPFTGRWAKAGLTDFDLAELQWSIIENPQTGAVISGAGGFRKVRFVPEHTGLGKSGAFRVLYLPNLRFGVVMLAFVYAKNEIANVNAAMKKSLAKQAAMFEVILKYRAGEQL